MPVISVAAEDGGGVVGHILFSKLQSPGECLGLAPVSVAPDRQGDGVGDALVTAGLERAKAVRWRADFLLGAPEYYQRFGFSVSAAHKFETIYPKAYVMALDLQPGALAQLSGALAYALSFLDLEG